MKRGSYEVGGDGGGRGGGRVQETVFSQPSLKLVKLRKRRKKEKKLIFTDDDVDGDGCCYVKCVCFLLFGDLSSYVSRMQHQNTDEQWNQILPGRRVALIEAKRVDCHGS